MLGSGAGVAAGGVGCAPGPGISSKLRPAELFSNCSLTPASTLAISLSSLPGCGLVACIVVPTSGIYQYYTYAFVTKSVS